jgi:hypothetical protein
MIPLIELEGTWSEITARLPDFKEQRLRVIVLRASESSANGGSGKRSLSERLAEIRSADPEAWDQLPADLAEEHDHYIYGSPKKR